MKKNILDDSFWHVLFTDYDIGDCIMGSPYTNPKFHTLKFLFGNDHITNPKLILYHCVGKNFLVTHKFTLNEMRRILKIRKL